MACPFDFSTPITSASAGILTGVIIGMARAIGETAPIITIGALTFIASAASGALSAVRQRMLAQPSGLITE